MVAADVVATGEAAARDGVAVLKESVAKAEGEMERREASVCCNSHLQDASYWKCYGDPHKDSSSRAMGQRQAFLVNTRLFHLSLYCGSTHDCRDLYGLSNSVVTLTC